MKKSFLSKSVALLLSFFALASCGGNNASSMTSSAAEATSSSVAASSASSPATSSSVLSSSEASSSSVASSSSPDFVSQAKLTTDYTNKQFLTDGIGQVTLKEKVDGDTAHFQQVSGSTLTIKGRYLCIDTPESTGMVEPWGHGASAYNGTLLANAKTIVLSSDSHGDAFPAKDSTGSRYLVYVWVSTAETPTLDSFILVNLALVQEGWSKAKGATGTDYGQLFIDASAQAQSEQLHVWSSAPDPDFNYSAPTTTTLKSIIDGVDSEGNAFDWIGSKATFTGIVTMTGPDKGAAFVNKDFTWDDNGTSVTKRYGIYIFTSYIAYYPLKTIGNEVQITGLVSEYEGTKQIVAVSYNEYYPEEGDMKILSTGNVMAPLTGTAKELAVDQNINVVCTVTLDCTGGYATQNAATSTAYSYSLYCQDNTGRLNVYIVDSLYIKYTSAYLTHKVGERVMGDDGLGYFKGATSLTITGGLVTYITTAGVKTYQIKLARASDLVVTY